MLFSIKVVFKRIYVKYVIVFTIYFCIYFNLLLFNFAHRLTYAIIKYDAQMYSIISIDASHELAMFIKTIENGTTLTHSPSFCIENKKNCATYVKNSVICVSIFKQILVIKSILCTCSDFYKLE